MPAVPIGKPGYRFQFPVESPQGQEERREHERLRKADRRAAARPTEPPPLPPAAVVDASQAPPGQQGPGAADSPGQVVAEPFVPWVAADVEDSISEIVELMEAKRVADFVTLAKEAKMPVGFIARVEKDAGYPIKSKAALKRHLAECAAKWLNKSGVSSKNKEEVKLMWCLVTIKLQGLRLKKDLLAMIADDHARRASEQKPTRAEEPPALAIVR